MTDVRNERVEEGAPAIPDCGVCGAARTLAFRARVLNKYDAAYHFCGRCGLLQSEDPWWLEEAYAGPIADIDTDVAARNLWCARRLTGLLYFQIGRDGRFLDAAGGYGLLTRLMRDAGFDYYWSDPYSSNLFARGFERDAAKAPFSAVSAFEVLEHVRDPVGFLRQILSEQETQTIVLSTELFRGSPPSPGRWQYYAFTSGQHISFYRASTLQTIAQTLGLRFYSQGRLHVMSTIALNRWAFHVLTSRAAVLVDLWVRSRLQSLTARDRDELERRKSL